ncbi:MAG: GvpL/GvpF family gas vesicle protein, partial [Actinomycetota bacterium]|nr:GvpL/GvpF family gas vesicle protein [Actinomycetota bacterium]
MSLLLYAIADADAAAVEGAGVGQAPLTALGTPGLVAVVAEQTGPLPMATEEALWEHERVIERLMARHAVLPARFGSVLRDRSHAQELLASRREQLEQALSLVRGAVELSLHAGWRAQATASAVSGTAYMLGRLAQLRRAHEIAAELHALDGLARASRRRVAQRPGAAVVAAYLVDRSLVGTFADKVKRLDQGLPDVDVVCTGPWPPYSFADSARGAALRLREPHSGALDPDSPG